MRIERTTWASAAAFVSIFAVTGCEIIAFSTGSSSSSSSGTGSGSSSATGMEKCTAASIPYMLMTTCGAFCASYVNSCSTADRNQYGSSEACYAFCETFGSGTNSIACRTAQLKGGLTTKQECIDAGPYSTTCGTPNQDALDAFNKICMCSGPSPTSLDATKQAWLKAAAGYSASMQCLSTAACFCTSIATGVDTSCMCAVAG